MPKQFIKSKITSLYKLNEIINNIIINNIKIYENDIIDMLNLVEIIYDYKDYNYCVPKKMYMIVNICDELKIETINRIFKMLYIYVPEQTIGKFDRLEWIYKLIRNGYNFNNNDITVLYNCEFSISIKDIQELMLQNIYLDNNIIGTFFNNINNIKYISDPINYEECTNIFNKLKYILSPNNLIISFKIIKINDNFEKTIMNIINFFVKCDYILITNDLINCIKIYLDKKCFCTNEYSCVYCMYTIKIYNIFKKYDVNCDIDVIINICKIGNVGNALFEIIMIDNSDKKITEEHIIKLIKIQHTENIYKIFKKINIKFTETIIKFIVQINHN